ncbi:hypothetical protein D9758_004135 [Tetrapyrgos nigripes]|uniref:Uncharacterized protein n=1 Tax=Tetrapyrgos nigripes TaxID=182062 RepID=A0A8H5GUF5_9AGAR|nr:hypothetical protein D9758_004135 [Tetrapyrgos nigripes]
MLSFSPSKLLSQLFRFFSKERPSYPNPSKLAGAGEILFPVTDKSFVDTKYLLKKGFQEHRDTSRLVLRLKNAGDDASHLVVTRLQYCQCQARPMHEFIVVFFQDVDASDCGNYFIIERTRPENYVQQKINLSRIGDLGDEDVDSPSNPRSTSRRERFTDDLLRVSCTRNVDGLKKLVSSRYITLAEIDATMHQHRLTVGQILVLTALVHAHTPHYRLYHAQAYYHTRMIWKIANMLAGINAEPMLRCRRVAFAEVKQKVQSNVANDALVVKEKYDEVWRDFRTSVDHQREVHIVIKPEFSGLTLHFQILERPLREAEAERDSAWAQLQEAKSRRDEAFDLVQVLESELAELRRLASAHSTR